MEKITIGVDLGTTNTCAAIVKDGIAKFLELEPNSLTMPSAVRFVDGKADNVVIGRLAKRFAIVKPKEVFVSFKTLMQNEEWLNNPEIVESYKIDGKQFTPTDMAAKLLTHIYEIAQSSDFATEGTINNIKICVPAASTPYYKKEVINAAIQAGFGERDENGEVIYIEEEIGGNKVRMPQGITTIEEPFAAAYSYGQKNGFFDQDKAKDQNIMVYDFGGGTFDVSIINVSTEKGGNPEFKLLGTYGITHLGGDDIDMAIMKIAAKQFYKEHKIDLINADKDNKGLKKRDVLTAQSTLKELSERAKIEDFAQGATEAHIEQLSIIYDQEDDCDCNLDVIIPRDKFLESIHPLLDKTIECTKKAIQESKLELDDINRFVLVGGSTKAPWVRETVKSFVGKDPYCADNVDVIVGEGAALICESPKKIIDTPPTGKGEEEDKENQQNKENNQTDKDSEKEEKAKPTTINKTSQHYGVEVRGGFFIPLIIKGLPFDDEHSSYSGSIKCTNSNDSGTVYITGWSTQEDVIEKDESGEPIKGDDGNYVSNMSVHAIKNDGEKIFNSIGQFRIDVPKAEAHTLNITLTLTILKDNTLNLEVIVNDNEPIVQPW